MEAVLIWTPPIQKSWSELNDNSDIKIKSFSNEISITKGEEKIIVEGMDYRLFAASLLPEGRVCYECGRSLITT